MTDEVFEHYTPNVFKNSTVPLGAGAHTIWTPASGKRIRLLGFDFEISNDATLAVAGDNSITVQETGGVIIHRFIASVGATASTVPGQITYQFIPGEAGYLSIAPDNILSLLFNTAFITGSIVANAWGMEE